MMFSIFKSVCTGLSLCALFTAIFSSYVQAGTFFYEDGEENFTITFPDVWKRITNQKKDDQITIAAPGVNDFAVCRVRVQKDRRYLIYPGKFDSDIQKTAYSRSFWDKYLGEYDNVLVEGFKDYAALARGYASMAEASYETAEGATVQKKGIMFATLYHDRAYIAECSAEKSVFYKWRPVFLSIIKSMEITASVRHSNPHGSYRLFNDKNEKVEVLGPRKLDSYKF